MLARSCSVRLVVSELVNEFQRQSVTQPIFMVFLCIRRPCVRPEVSTGDTPSDDPEGREQKAARTPQYRTLLVTARPAATTRTHPLRSPLQSVGSPTPFHGVWIEESRLPRCAVARPRFRDFCGAGIDVESTSQPHEASGIDVGIDLP